MLDQADYMVLMFLLTLLIFVCLMVIHRLLKALMLNHFMKSLASELGFSYTQTVPLRPPAINGFYRGREVVVDSVEKENKKHTRVRVFHIGNVEKEFTIAPRKYFSDNGLSSMKVDVEDERFRSEYQISGGRSEVVRRFLDAPMQKWIASAHLSFTVGKHEVYHLEPALSRDKEQIMKAVNFLVDLGGKADLL